MVKAVEPVTGPAAPKNKGSAMTPEETMRTESDYETMERRELRINRGGYAKEPFFPEELALSDNGVVAGREDILKFNNDLLKNPRGEVFTSKQRTMFSQAFLQDLSQNMRRRFGKPEQVEAEAVVEEAPRKPLKFSSFEELGAFLNAEKESAPNERALEDTVNAIEYAKAREDYLIEFAKGNMELLGVTDVNAAVSIARSLIKPRNAPERFVRQMLVLKQDNPLRTLSYSDWKTLDNALSNFTKGHGDGPSVRKQLDQLFGSPDITGSVLEMYREGRSDVAGQNFDGGVTGTDRTVMRDDERAVERGGEEVGQELPTQLQWSGENTTGVVPAFEQRRVLAAEERVKAAEQKLNALAADGVTEGEQFIEAHGDLFRAKKDLKPRKYYDTRNEEQLETMTRAEAGLAKAGGEGARVNRVGVVDREIEARGLTDPEQIERAQLEIVNELFPTRQLDYSPKDDHIKSRRLLFEKDTAEYVKLANSRFKALKGEKTTFAEDTLAFTDREVKDVRFELKKEKLNTQKFGVERGTLAFHIPGQIDPLVTSAPKLIAAMLNKPGRESAEENQNAVEENAQLLSQAITSMLVKLGEKVDPELIKNGKGPRVGYVVTEMSVNGVKGKPVWLKEGDEFPPNFKLRDQKNDDGGVKKTVIYGDVVKGKAERDRREGTKLTKRVAQAVKEIEGRFHFEFNPTFEALPIHHSENPSDATNNAHVIALHRRLIGGQFDDISECKPSSRTVSPKDMAREVGTVNKEVIKSLFKMNLPRERYEELWALRDRLKNALDAFWKYGTGKEVEALYKEYVIGSKDAIKVVRHETFEKGDKDTQFSPMTTVEYRKYLKEARDVRNRSKIAELNGRIEENTDEGIGEKLKKYRDKLIAQNREITNALNGHADLQAAFRMHAIAHSFIESSWGMVPSENTDIKDAAGAPIEKGNFNNMDPVGENVPIHRDRKTGVPTAAEAPYFQTGASQPRGERRVTSERIVSMGGISETKELPLVGRVRRTASGKPIGLTGVTDDFGNVATESVTFGIGEATRPAKPDELPSRIADANSLNSDPHGTATKALPESARALYKTESPGEWVASVLAPRGGVEAALKAWDTVKNAATENMKRSKMLFARALHTIADMQPENFRLEFNKKLTDKQSQTMIDRAKSVIEQGRVPDDRPGTLDKGATESSALGEGRQDDDGGAREARGTDARVVPGAATDTGPVASTLQRPDTGAVARGAETERRNFSSERSNAEVRTSDERGALEAVELAGVTEESSEGWVARDAGSSRGITRLEDQLRAYLPLAEASNKPLAGAIRKALDEIAAGRSLKSHEGALAAATRRFGELDTRVKRSEITPDTLFLPKALTERILSEDNQPTVGEIFGKSDSGFSK